MSAVELLTKAVQYDNCGRKIEALKLYINGIQELNLICAAEVNSEKRNKFKHRISEYLERAEHIKLHIQSCLSKGEIRDKIAIIDGSIGYSYRTVFGKYLDNNVKEIIVEEPYLRDFYQLVNLVIFCELAVSNCYNLKFIKVITVQDNDGEQSKAFQSLHDSLKIRNVGLQFEFSGSLHDRQVLLSNGFIIKIGRGLNYFKGQKNKFCLGAFDFDFRECKATNIDILFSPELKK